MLDIIKGASFFAWPLLACSFIAAFIIIERFIALRRVSVLPRRLQDQILDGNPTTAADHSSAMGRILAFEKEHPGDSDAVKAYARVEINHMERGFVFLEIIVGIAPLIGLLGTVTALIKVFGAISPEVGAAAHSDLTKGIALALSTTVLGLAVAIPSLFFSSLLGRRVETYAVTIEELLERLLHKKTNSSEK